MNEIMRRKERATVDKQNIAVRVHADGSCAVKPCLLRPSPLFPVAYHAIILYGRVVGVYHLFPVVLKVSIDEPDRRVGAVDWIKNHKGTKDRIEMRIVGVVEIPHISGTLERIFVLIHTGIDGCQQAKLLAPFFCRPRIPVMLGCRQKL